MRFRIALATLVVSMIFPFRVLAAVLNVPSGNIMALLAAIETANSTAEPDIIHLEPGAYILQSVETDVSGPTGLPVISSIITIKGESDLTTSIQRDPDAPLFRIFHVAAGAILTLENVTVRGGLLLGVQNGAGIQNFGVTNIKNSSISNNGIVFGLGGGIHSTGTLNVTKTLINLNDALAGAGVSSEGNLIMTDSTVSDNVDGGGIRTTGPTTIRNSTIVFNSGFDAPQAGAINHSFGLLKVVNSTIGGNRTLSPGGNLSNFSGTVLITNSTIAENISNRDGTVKIQNTILAGSGGFGGFGTECEGEITSLGNNIVADPLNCSVGLLPTDLTGDPGLAEFNDNEEPGEGHFPLLPTSQAIDAAKNSACLKTDQLGNLREGVCDIGSIEFQRTIRVVEELPATEVNVAYTAGLEVIGGTPPYTAEIVEGSLPEGLTLNELTISGVPLRPATSVFVLKVTDQAGDSGSQRLRIRVFKAIDIITDRLRTGRVGSVYSQTLKATGGKKPYAWSIAGTLPTGLTFDELTGQITGVPSSPDSVNLIFRVTDDFGGIAEENLSLIIK
jgi:hypothetical protein